MKQQSLASLAYEGMRGTKREKFLNEMERVVPWEWLRRLRAAPLESGQRPPAFPAGSDAAGLLPATMVRLVRPWRGGVVIRHRIHAPFCRR